MVDINSSERSLIEAAAVAVQRAIGQLFEGREAVSHFSPSELDAMSREEQEAALRREVEAYRARPELAAIHFCLASSNCLLEVSRSLIEQTVAQSPQEQVNLNKALIEDTKAAGRAAYRAALIMSDIRAPFH